MNPKRRGAQPGKDGRRRTGSTRGGRAGLLTGLALGALVAAFVGVLYLSGPQVSGDGLRYDQLVSLTKQGRIKFVRLLDEDAYAVGSYIRDDGTVAEFNAPLLHGTQPDLLDLLLSSGVPITVDQQVGKRVTSLAAVLLPGVMVVVLLGYMTLSYKRGSGLFRVRSGARRAVTGDGVVTTFADVAGQDAAVTELREITEFLSDAGRFAELGAQVPKGILLYGPPGCGKTLMARALAGEAGAAFFSISGSDFVEVYVGVGAARVRDLFKEARENAPAVIFIDELDSIGKARTTAGGGRSQGEQEQGLNQILTEMDGFSPSAGIVVLAATNRPDVLDPALLRPGRFDRTVGLERPDEKARLAILTVHASGKRLGAEVDLADLARRAIGLTGADLASVLNEGALLSARSHADAISQGSLDAALQRILDAPERQRRLSLRGRSVGKRFTGEERVTFADVAGVDEALDELGEIRDYLASPDRFARMGARPPRGILLTGPAGCGKTLLARAVAGEANAAFISVVGSEFVEVFLGEGAARVRDLFAEARSLAPAIVFIDEIDSIGASRSTGAQGSRELDQTLNQILVELDGFEPHAGVLLMAATNRPDMLDAALVRPGRFDRQLTISLPDRAGRTAILVLHASGKPFAPDVDFAKVAALTQGFSGADLANVLNESALLATRKGSAEITMAMVDEGIDRAVLGVVSRGTVLTDDERRIVAYHESGHALVALGLPGARVPHKLSLVPRSFTLGHCTMEDTHDRVLRTRSSLLDELAVIMAGRAAEELVFGEPVSGSAHDLQAATTIARQMVCEWGMGPASGRLALAGDRFMSDDDARVAATETRQLVDDAYERARTLLMGTRQALDACVAALLERETLRGDQLAAIASAVRANS